MKIVGFRADADLVGRRIRVSWDSVPEELETLADIPAVKVRRKTRDFEFPPPVIDDPYLVYDSSAFPPPPSPPDVTVTDLPGWQSRSDGTLAEFSPISVARHVNGASTEVLRVTEVTMYDAMGTAVSLHTDLLDLGDSIGGLASGITYYYEISSAVIPSGSDPSSYRAAATATERHGLNRRLYEMLPEIYRRHDVTKRPDSPGCCTVPEMANSSGQLRRFLDLFGTALDSLRSTADGLGNLHDVDNVDYRYLPLLARWIGWDLSFDLPIPVWRNEIKSAPHLYSAVGTASSVRALVNRYTGWSATLAEFSQQIARSNLPPQFNIFALAENPDGWAGADDVATMLGFGAANRTAVGSAAMPATLVGTASEPFALRSGMELSIAADAEPPETARLGSADFTSVAAATAAEVAAALNRTVQGVTASAAGGRLQIRSHSTDAVASIAISPSQASLVTLESAPAGRPAVLVDRLGRVRLFYDVASPPGSRDSHQDLPPASEIHYKTFAAGTWGNSHRLAFAPEATRGSPAAVELPGGDVFLAFVEDPGTGQARIRTVRGAVPDPMPARLVGQRRGPFNVDPDTKLTFRGEWAGPEAITFAATDFANPQQATPAEVAAAFNARLTHVGAAVLPNGAILLESQGTGPDARLQLDLRQSSGAQILGFDARNSSAVGSWSDLIAWSSPQDVPTVLPGRYADLAALVDATGQVWLFWASHVDGTWTIMSASWDGTAWSVPVAVAGGAGGNREPSAVLDASGRIWLFWARRRDVGTTEDVWTVWRRTSTGGASAHWDPEGALTDTSTGRATDREPAAVLLPGPGTGLCVFFRSDRAGGRNLWSVTVSPGDVVGAPVGPIASGAWADAAPAPLLHPDGRLWLLLRSDRGVSLSRVAAGQGLATDGAGAASPTALLPEAVTLRRYTGSATVVPTDGERNRGRGQWDDLLAYTPQRPNGDAPLDDELYTRGTIGLYIRGTRWGRPITVQNVNRLRQLLDRFLPINVRAVVILTPAAEVEYVYQSGMDLGESYLDKYPFAEVLGGLSDATAAALPGWSLLRSNRRGDTSANPADLRSLGRRTYFQPPQ